MSAIVDDEKLIRDSLRGLMKAAGLPALTFASAEEFLKSGEQEHSKCVIADIKEDECTFWILTAPSERD